MLIVRYVLHALVVYFGFLWNAVDGQSKRAAPPSQNPGIVFQLNDQALQMIKREVYRIILSLPGLRLNDVFEKPVKRLRLTITNMQIVRVVPPPRLDIRFVPNSRDQVVIEMAGLGLTTTAVVSTQFKNFKNMLVTTDMQKLSLALRLRLYADVNGHLQVLVDNCMANLGSVHINIAHTRRVPTNTERMASKLQQKVNEEMCPLIQSKLVQHVNRYLARTKTKIRIEDLFQNKTAFRQVQRKKSMLLNTIALEDPAVYSKLARHTVLDYRVLPEPMVNQRMTLEIPMKGEISWNGRGGTPLAAPIIQTGAIPQQHMANIIATEYLINTLLTNYHNARVFEYHINASHPLYGKYVRNSCSIPICIGVVLPDINRRYPGTSNTLMVKTTGPPKVVIRDGSALVRVPMTLSVAATRNWSVSPVLTIAMKPVFNVHLIGQNRKLYTRITEKEFPTSVTQNKLNFNRKQLEMFTDIMKTVILETLKLAVKEGMTFPLPPMVRIRNMTAQIKGNAIVIGLTTEMNHALISSMVADAVRKLSQMF